MAKKPNKAQLAILKTIASGVDGIGFVTQAEGQPLVDAGLIEVNASVADPNDPNKRAARLTQESQNMVGSTNGAVEAASAPAASNFTIITDAVIPPSKRGNRSGGAAPRYPFADLPVGGSFFVETTAKHSTPDAIAKSLGSVVSAMNAKYSEDTGQTKQVERTKRGEGNKAVVGADGKNVRETVTVPVKKALRKFAVRPIEGGKKYGNWTAPADGALVARVAIEG